ncbi:hypothetical protein Tco_0922584 [Tanacetum coccineum]|uniref:Uncharacterized protein n=1 Tax=Tanacetum coccineum TaxID=301880 RepID=A0ABQ5CYI4_9ASTR
MAFVSSSNNNTNSTNEAVNTAHGVITANSTNIDNLSDAVICLFFASQPNSPQLAHEDLQQIHPYDIEEIDLRWQMAMLTMKARRFLKNTGNKLTVNGNKTIGFDKSKVSALQLHQERTFCLKECKLQEIKTTRTRKAQEGVCWENYFYSFGELWCHVMVLVDMTGVIRQRKGLIMHSWLTHLQVLTQSLNKLIECQVVDNCKKGLGYEKYNAVPSPYIGNFMPPTPDLSFTGLDEFVNKPVVENRKSDEEVSKAMSKRARSTRGRASSSFKQWKKRNSSPTRVLISHSLTPSTLTLSPDHNGLTFSKSTSLFSASLLVNSLPHLSSMPPLVDMTLYTRASSLGWEEWKGKCTFLSLDVELVYTPRGSLERNPRIRLAHRFLTMTITGRKETTHRVIEIDLFYLYCIFGDGIVCNIPYWLAKYLKSVKEKSVIFGGIWPATREVTGEGGGNDEESDREGGNEGIGGSADIYRNMSQEDGFKQVLLENIGDNIQLKCRRKNKP